MIFFFRIVSIFFLFPAPIDVVKRAIFIIFFIIWINTNFTISKQQFECDWILFVCINNNNRNSKSSVLSLQTHRMSFDYLFYFFFQNLPWSHVFVFFCSLQSLIQCVSRSNSWLKNFWRKKILFWISITCLLIQKQKFQVFFLNLADAGLLLLRIY